MRLPIDTSGMSFVVAGAVEPVRDFESKQPRTDENGSPLFSVPLMVLGDNQPEIISVKLAGEAPAVAPGQPAKVTYRPKAPTLSVDANVRTVSGTRSPTELSTVSVTGQASW